MPRPLVALLVAAATLTVVTATPTTMAAGPPVHTLAVSGTGVGMYPAFRGATQRYALTTTDATGGSVSVTATTSDPAGTVWVDGRRAVGGRATVPGLTAGDEISVLIKDSAGTEVHSLVYLPPQFPKLSAVDHGSPAGDVLLTLSKFTNGTPNFETAVDRNGVPSYVRSSLDGSLDLKQLPNGHYTVSRQPTTTPGRTGSALVELDSAFQEVGRRFETASPLVNTDGHDSIVRPNGNRVLVAYEPNPLTLKTDAVIQEVDPQGGLVFEWNTKDHVLAADGVGDATDYAHINSIMVMPDGDILASFRHLSQVMKIAWSAHDGFAPGDVVWRLGGRRSSFTFVDDPSAGGPCAQHTASVLPNGHILMYDNGSFSSAGPPAINPMCIDPTNRGGPTIARPQTRITEYALDTVAGTATLVWSYQVPGRFAIFAGSAERLADANTLIGWASARDAVASLVDPAGTLLWELKDDNLDVTQRYFTYRAAPATVADTLRPVLDVVRPAQGASYAFGQRVTSDFGCTDRGGSSLRSCGGTVVSGGSVNTSVAGTHVFRVVARDGARNSATVSRTYHVGAEPVLRQPDALIRTRVGTRLLGGNVYGSYTLQDVHQAIARRGSSASAVVRFQNDGNRTDRLRLLGTSGSRGFGVSYTVDGRNVTGRVTAGTYRTPTLLPGRSTRMVVTVTRTRALAGDSRTFRLRAMSVNDTRKTDAVATVVRASR